MKHNKDQTSSKTFLSDTSINGLNIAGVPERSKGQGLGVLTDVYVSICINTKKPCDVGLRAFKSLPLHYIKRFKVKIIAFAGLPFSGKSEAVEIAKEMKIPVIRMGDAIWEETKNQGLELSDKNVGKIANQMRKEHGMDIWARRTLENMRLLDKEEIIVIDGVRNNEEIETFKQELNGDFIVVAIEASTKTRHRRAMNRGRQDDSKDEQQIKERDQREIGWGLNKVIDDADITIENEGSIDEFKEEINKLLDELFY